MIYLSVWGGTLSQEPNMRIIQDLLSPTYLTHVHYGDL